MSPDSTPPRPQVPPLTPEQVSVVGDWGHQCSMLEMATSERSHWARRLQDVEDGGLGDAEQIRSFIKDLDDEAAKRTTLRDTAWAQLTGGE